MTVSVHKYPYPCFLYNRIEWSFVTVESQCHRKKLSLNIAKQQWQDYMDQSILFRLLEQRYKMRSKTTKSSVMFSLYLQS